MLNFNPNMSKKEFKLSYGEFRKLRRIAVLKVCKGLPNAHCMLRNFDNDHPEYLLMYCKREKYNILNWIADSRLSKENPDMALRIKDLLENSQYKQKFHEMASESLRIRLKNKNYYNNII